MHLQVKSRVSSINTSQQCGWSKQTMVIIYKLAYGNENKQHSRRSPAEARLKVGGPTYGFTLNPSSGAPAFNEFWSAKSVQ